MKNLFLILGIFLVISSFFSVKVYADEKEDFLDNTYDIIDELDTESLEELFSNNEYYNSIYGNSVKEKLKHLLTSEVDNQDFMQTLIKGVLFDFSKFLPFFITLFIIAVFSGMFESVKPDGRARSMYGAVYLVCYLCSIILLISQFVIIVDDVTDTVQNLSGQMQVVMPLILSLMAISGMSSSVAIYRPIVLVLSNSVTQFILAVLIPLVTGITIINILSQLSDGLRINRFKDLMASVFKWIIGLTLTIFSFFLTIKGVTASTADGVSLSAIKYMSSQVPIVGGFLREGTDIFLASALLIKNAVGKMAVFIFFWEMLTPVVSLIVIMFGLNTVSAIAEPFADGKLINAYSGMAKSIGYLLSILLMVLFMFVLTVLLLICSSSIL